MKKIFITFLLTFTLLANENNETKLTDDQLMDRVLYTNLIGGGVVTLWGVAFWDYFSTQPVMGSEGWFGSDTKYGGADKFGHMYSTYLWSLGFGSLYESWGMNQKEAAIYGAGTSWIFQGLMEVGDSFSVTQGFSYEDMIMNTLGAGLYVLREFYPSIKNKIDMRLEYIPNWQGEEDFFTQYNSMKYLFAFKGSGFDFSKDNLLKYSEFHIGYYTRGYQNSQAYEQKERVVYAAIGINISELLNVAGWKKTAGIFNYYQMPYSYLPYGYDFDSKSSVKPYSRPYYGYMK